MRFNNRQNGKSDFDDFSRFLGLGAQRTAEGVTKSTEISTSQGKSLAMVYPEKQRFVRLFDPEIALQNGTMFEELNLPFYGGSCKGSNNGEGC
ncbi:MAG: spore coat associated protein CotJA [Clostridia bacterium]|nr:spore coat associated protein CotJA [Clostridia bacterium]